MKSRDQRQRTLLDFNIRILRHDIIGDVASVSVLDSRQVSPLDFNVKKISCDKIGEDASVSVPSSMHHITPLGQERC